MRRRIHGGPSGLPARAARRRGRAWAFGATTALLALGGACAAHAGSVEGAKIPQRAAAPLQASDGAGAAQRPRLWWKQPLAAITDEAAFLQAWNRANAQQKGIAVEIERALLGAQRGTGAQRVAGLRDATLWQRRYVARRRALSRTRRTATFQSKKETTRGRDLARLQTCLAHVATHEGLVRDHSRTLGRWRVAVQRGARSAAAGHRAASRRAAALLPRSRKVVFSCAQASRHNLTANPSFELGTFWWNAFNSVLTRRRDPKAPDGRWVGQVTWTAGEAYTMDDLGATVASTRSGATYVARAWVRAAGPTSEGKTVRMVLRERTRVGHVRQFRGPDATLTDGYQRLTVVATKTLAGSELDILIAQFDAGPGDGILIDQVVLSPRS